MKKIILCLALLIACTTISFAQCDKKILITSSVTEYLDSTGTLQRSKDENSSVEINKTDIVITPGDEKHQISGMIKSNTCDWSIPFKEGKSVIKATLTDPRGEIMNATITITGKDGKIILLFELAETPDRKIRITVVKFEEVK